MTDFILTLLKRNKLAAAGCSFSTIESGTEFII